MGAIQVKHRTTTSSLQQPETASQKAVVITGASTGAILGGTIGSAFGPLGILAGVVAGAVIGAFAALAMLATNAFFGLLTDRQIQNRTVSTPVVEQKPADPKKRVAAENILQKLTSMDDESLSKTGIGRVGNSSSEILNQAASENAEIASSSAIDLVATLKFLFHADDGPDIMSKTFDSETYNKIQELIDNKKTDEAIKKIKEHLNEKDTDLSGKFILLLNRISSLNANNSAAILNLGGFSLSLTKKIDDPLSVFTIMKGVIPRSTQMGQKQDGSVSAQPAVGTFMIQYATKIFSDVNSKTADISEQSTQPKTEPKYSDSNLLSPGTQYVNGQ